MSTPTECPKCEGKMISGYIIDSTLLSTGVGRWVAKEKVKVQRGGNLKLNAVKDGIPVATFKCSSCGYLEAYAGTDFAPE